MLLLCSTVCPKHQLICICICSISKCLLPAIFSGTTKIYQPICSLYGVVVTSRVMFQYYHPLFYQYSITCNCSLRTCGEVVGIWSLSDFSFFKIFFNQSSFTLYFVFINFHSANPFSDSSLFHPSPVQIPPLVSVRFQKIFNPSAS